MQQFGFDKVGGFFAIDHFARDAAYAYPTSPNADAAKRNPAKIAKRMLAENQRDQMPEGLRERHYLNVCANGAFLGAGVCLALFLECF